MKANRVFHVVATPLLCVLVAVSLCWPPFALADAGLAAASLREAQVSGSLQAQAAQAVYSQADGYEPYVGWQDACWNEWSDPAYEGGAGGTSRKGYAAWSLTSPLSRGVLDFQTEEQGFFTGDSVKVVTDANACRADGEPTFAKPWYYKNVILEPYDVSAPMIGFSLAAVSTGARAVINDPGTYLPKMVNEGGFAIATSDDPSTWEGDDSTVVWKATVSDVAYSEVRSSDNWWLRMNVTASTDRLQAGRTYYFIVKHNTPCGYGRLYADLVFEFTTDTAAERAWSGDLTRAAYGREQGHGGIIFGVLDPDPRALTTDLALWDSCFHDRVIDEMEPDANGDVSFVIHSGGSGSNWHSLLNWQAYGRYMNVYDTDPVSGGAFNADGLQPVASYAAGTLSLENAVEGIDLPTVNGVRLTMSGLSPGREYYLVLDKWVQIANSTHQLTKPIVIGFKVADARPWDVSAAGDGSVSADVSAAGTVGARTLALSGAGTVRGFAAAGQAPWAWYAAYITSVQVGEGVTGLGAYALAGLANPALSLVRMPSTLVSVDANALAGSTGVIAIDLGACTAAAETAAAAGLSLAAGSLVTGAAGGTVYVDDPAAVAAVADAGAVDAAATCVAALNGGELADGASLVAGELAVPRKRQHRFTGWYADEACTQSATWAAIGPDGSGARYAGWEWAPSDFTALDAAVERAQQALSGTCESADGSDVADGRTWVPPARFAALRDAVAAVQALGDDAYQEDVDAALAGVRSAQDAFDAACATASVDRYALRFAAAAGASTLAGAQPSADGADVPASAQWVPQGVYDELSAAIAVVSAVAADADATAAQADGATARLAAARAAFDAAKRPGMLRTQPASWKRLSGAVALDTMRSIVAEGFASSDAVIVATVDGYWDALAASALAGAQGAPVLLTQGGSLSDQTRAEVQRLGAVRAYVVGGEAAVSARVEDDLHGMGCSVKRLWGADAQATARAIAAEVGAQAGDTCVVATSGGYWDALAASPYAYARCAPVFLTDVFGKLAGDTLAAVQAGGFSRVVIAGGTAVVPEATADELRASGLEVVRLAGADAYGTAAELARWEIGQGLSADCLGVATAGGYWDALCGAAFCGSRGSVLVLADAGRTDAVSQVVAPNAAGIWNGYVFGGEAAVAPQVQSACEEATR